MILDEHIEKLFFYVIELSQYLIIMTLSWLHHHVINVNFEHNILILFFFFCLNHCYSFLIKIYDLNQQEENFSFKVNELLLNLTLNSLTRNNSVHESFTRSNSVYRLLTRSNSIYRSFIRSNSTFSLLAKSNLVLDWLSNQVSNWHFELESRSSRIAHIFNLTRLDSTENWVNLIRLAKNSSLTSRELNIEIFPTFALSFCIIFLIES